MICLEFHTYKMKDSTWKIQLIYAWTIVFADKNKLYAAWTEVLAVNVTDLLVDVEIAPNIYDSKNSFVFFCIVASTLVLALVWLQELLFLHKFEPNSRKQCLQEPQFERHTLVSCTFPCHIHCKNSNLSNVYELIHKTRISTTLQ